MCGPPSGLSLKARVSPTFAFEHTTKLPTAALTQLWVHGAGFCILLLMPPAGVQTGTGTSWATTSQ